MKDKAAKRMASEKAKIEALIEKHRPHTLKTPEEVNISGTDKNANTNGQKGIEKEKPPHKKAQRLAKSKHPKIRVIKPTKVNQIHC